MARTLARVLTSLLVPPLCAACREPELSGAPLCPECRAGLVPLGDVRCERCGAPLGAPAAACSECRGRRLHFARAWAPYAYEGTCRAVVAALKARGALALAPWMAREIARRAPAGLLDGALVPVPAHAARRRRHGFNQAHELSRALAARVSQPCRDLLRRRQSAAPQIGLERAARLANARRSVFLPIRSQVPERVVLVDDVYTTGATLDACAEALRAAGAREITAVTFARAIRD